MRIVVDLPPKFARLSAEAVENGLYGSIDDLIVEALAAHFRDEASPTRPAGLDDVAHGTIAERVTGTSVHNSNPSAGWLWGMVNRVYPLKVAARVCADLARQGPVLLQTLHAAFAA